MSGTYRGFKILALVALISAFVVALPIYPARAATSTVTVKPAADVYVSSAYPSTNYGTSTQLRIDGSPTVRSYLKFSVSGVGSGSVTSAVLRIYANSTNSAGYTVYAESSSSWSEASITYSNAPALGSALKASGAVSTGAWNSIDVTGYVTGDGVYSLALASSSSTATSLASREAGSNAPQLVLTIGTTPSINPLPTPVPTSPVTTSSSDAILVGAGDIARCNYTGDEQTGALIKGIPGTVMAIGDTAYDSGTTAQYTNCYQPSWGAFKSRTKPAVGNHEYNTSGASGYQNYFGTAAGPAGKFYYSYHLGSWHVVVLNSECSKVPGGCGAGSPQETWLKQDLAANPSQCTLAYWHEPYISSGEHGNTPSMKTFWQDLYNAGVELVLNGHDHDYERFAPMNPSGGLDTTRGIREIVVGTGGGTLRSFGTIKANSQKRIANVYGVLKLTLRSGSYDWQFVPVAGKTATDSGSDTCR